MEDGKPSKKLHVCVCGGGNGAHCAAGYIASKGYTVNILTRRPNDWGKEIKVTTATSSWAHRGDFVGRLNVVSDNARDVIPTSHVILLAAPAHVHSDILSQISPFINSNSMVGTIFAQGGFDWIALDTLGERLLSKITLFGMQNIPWICKVTKYGHESRILGPKQKLHVCTFPVERVSKMAGVLTNLFDIPCHTLPNFLTVTLTPSNQIIHPARYASIFQDYDGIKTYSKEELEDRKGLTLYEDFDPLSAEKLAKLDNELQTIRMALVLRFPQLNLSQLPPIKERIVAAYGKDVADTSSLLQVMRTNKGYVGCATPLKSDSNGRFYPNADCRLFWEDIPYGLCIIKNLAELMGDMPVPTVCEMIRWHQQFMGKEYLTSEGNLNPITMMETGAPGRYGLHDIEKIVKTCLPQHMIEYNRPVFSGWGHNVAAMSKL